MFNQKNTIFIILGAFLLSACGGGGGADCGGMVERPSGRGDFIRTVSANSMPKPSSDANARK